MEQPPEEKQLSSEPNDLRVSQMLSGSWFTHPWPWFLPLDLDLRKLASLDLDRAIMAAAAAAFFFFFVTLTWPMQVTFGEEGSAASMAAAEAAPFFLEDTIGDWPPPLPLLRILRLREE